MRYNNGFHQKSLVAETMQRRLVEKWDSQISTVRSMYKEEFTPDKALRLAMVLQNTQNALNQGLTKRGLTNESATQLPDIGPFPVQAFNMVAGMYPASILDEIVSLQAMDRINGECYFMEYTYGNDKGNVKAGDTMLSPFTGAANYNSFAGEQITDELLGGAGTTTIGTGGTTANLSYVPVFRGSLTISTGEDTYKDDGNGNILNSAGVVKGSLNYESGALTLTLNSAATEDVFANYTFDQSYVPANAGSIRINIKTGQITARPHLLKASYAFLAGTQMERAFGVNMDEALLEAATAELMHEREGEIIGQMWRQAGSSTSWSLTPPGTDYPPSLHYPSFVTKIKEACSQIFQLTKRAYGNFVIVGKIGYDVLSSLNTNTLNAGIYKPNGGVPPAGPHVCGMLDGNIKVIFNPFLPENQFLVGYKGERVWESGFVVGDYLPIFTTSLLTLDDFATQRGYASVYGQRMINNRMYVKGVIA